MKLRSSTSQLPSNKVVENYIEQSIERRSKNLRSTRFRKTWFIQDGKNDGKGTIKAPSPSNPELRLWTRRLPKSELDRLILANNRYYPHRDT